MVACVPRQQAGCTDAPPLIQANRIFWLVFALTLLCALPVQAQTAQWFTFDPFVVPMNGSGPVRLEVAFDRAPSRVSLELTNGQSIDLRDDGSDLDRASSDGVYTCSIGVGLIASLAQPDDIQRVLLGTLAVFAGTAATPLTRYNMLVDVYSPQIGTWTVRQLAPDVQATSRVVNIVDSGYFGNNDVRPVAQMFYRYYSDDYDFLNVVSIPGRFRNRSHVQVRTDATGTGAAAPDDSASYGSHGRLKGFSYFPLPDFFDGANHGFVHETGHQWVNYLQFPPFAAGVPHWPVSSMATGVMGFSIGGGGGEGGQFQCNVVSQDGHVWLLPTTSPPAFNDFDLYLMGLMPASEVRQQVVLTGASTAPPCTGESYAGAATVVGVDSIIAGAGPRSPDPSSAQRQFRAATIIVSRDALVSPETMWLYSWLTERAELETATSIHEGLQKGSANPFFVATGGRARIDTLLGDDADFALIAPEPEAAVTDANGATLHVAAVPTRRAFDEPVMMTCAASGPLVCSVTPQQVTPGSTGADVTVSVTRGAAIGAATVPASLVLMTLTASLHRRRRLAAFAFGAAVATVACGGTGSVPPPSSGTPPPSSPAPAPPAAVPTYGVTVSGTAGALQHTVTLLIREGS